MYDIIDKEKIRIQEYFLKQLSEGVSSKFYEEKYEEAKDLLNRGIISKDAYLDIEKTYYQHLDMIKQVNESFAKINELLNKKLFPDIESDIMEKEKTMLESALYHSDEKLLTIYNRCVQSLENEIKKEIDSLVKYIDSMGEDISFRKKFFSKSDISVTCLKDYKEVFKDGYEYIDLALKKKNRVYTSKDSKPDELLVVRKDDSESKLFDLYAYSLCEEIVNINALEFSGKVSRLETHLLEKLKISYKKLAKEELKLDYVQKAILFLNIGGFFEKLETALEEKVISINNSISKLSKKTSKEYEFLGVSKKIVHCNKIYLAKSKLDMLNIVTDEIKKLDSSLYSKGGYYYKYYLNINKKKRKLEREVGTINIPKSIFDDMDDLGSINRSILKEQFMDLYVDIGDDAYDKKILKEYLKNRNDKKDNVDVKQESQNDLNGDEIKGYYSLVNAPLKSTNITDKKIDKIVDKLKLILDKKLDKKSEAIREELFNEYMELIIRPDYNLTFYEFLRRRDSDDISEIMTLEREIEFSASLLYRVYLEMNLRMEFFEFAKDRGIKNLPLEYIQPELYKMSDTDKITNDFDRKKLEEMIGNG